MPWNAFEARARVVLVAGFCLLFPLAAPGQVVDELELESVQPSGSEPAEGTRPDLEQVAMTIIDQTNAFREEQGLSPVERNENLMEAAKYFAQFMARTDKYGHTADGKRPSERAKEHGYEYCIVTENIAYQYSSAGFETAELATKFVEGWKNSPGHRKNMLDKDVTQTGVAVARSDKTGNYYAVQMFGRPKSAQFEFKITNESSETVEYQIGERSFPLPPRYTRTHQRCRPAELVVQLADGKKKSVKPDDGAHFTITGTEGKLNLTTK